MKTTETKLPEPYEDLLITYNKTFSYGAYGSEKRQEIITKRGFYCTLFNTFSVPPEYREFNGKMLPHGFGGDHLKADQIISWKYLNQNSICNGKN